MHQIFFKWYQIDAFLYLTKCRNSWNACAWQALTKTGWEMLQPVPPLSRTDMILPPSQAPKWSCFLHPTPLPIVFICQHVFPGQLLIGHVSCWACANSNCWTLQQCIDAIHVFHWLGGTSPPFSYHTLVVNADRAASVAPFRQVVVFDGKLIYPEYLLGYYRVLE